MTSLQGDADLKLSAGVINCERYCGAMSCMHLKTISSNFNLMRCSTGSQWRFFSIGVTSSLLDLATRQAAMFCRCCNFLMDFFGIRQALSCSSRFWMQEGYAPWSHKHVEICSIWWMTMPLFGTLPSCTSHARGPSSILNCQKWLQCFLHFFNDGVMDELSTFNTSSGIAFFFKYGDVMIKTSVLSSFNFSKLSLIHLLMSKTQTSTLAMVFCKSDGDEVPWTFTSSYKLLFLFYLYTNSVPIKQQGLTRYVVSV